MLDINKKPLIPGAMYCCLIKDIDYNGNEFEVYGSLVRYGSNNTLYCVDYEDDETINPCFDELVPQNAGIDRRFITL